MHLLLLIALALAGLLTLVAMINLLTDPGGLYHGGKQARNLRLRKLALLRSLAKRPCATVVLGSSRVFNLALSGDARFPQPVLNFAVSIAKAEDYLASYLLVREMLLANKNDPVAAASSRRGEVGTEDGGKMPPPQIESFPKLVVVGVEHPAFHPSDPPQWEARTAGRYTQELIAIGALNPGPAWRWLMLLNPAQLHQSLILLQRRWKDRRRGASSKFRWQPDGTAQWVDQIEGKRNPRLLARQLRNFPATGLHLRSYTRIGEQRLAWFEALLAHCHGEGTRAVAYIVPVHPALHARLAELGFAPMHETIAAALAEACAAHGAQFHDWYDPAVLGLTAEHYRDAMHLTDEGQRIVADALAAQ